MTGSCGVAYALWHVLRNPEAVKNIRNASQLSTKAVDIAEGSIEQYRHRPSGVPWSLLFGEAGAYAIAALSTSAAAKFAVHDPKLENILLSRSLQHTQGFSDLARYALHHAECEEDELLYGRAGYLYGCLLINQYIQSGVIPDATLQALASTILLAGQSRAHQRAQACLSRSALPPLWWEWHGSPYLGAAHGAMGKRRSTRHNGISEALLYK